MRQIIIGVLVFLLWMILSTWYYANRVYPVFSQSEVPATTAEAADSLATTPEAPPLPAIPEDITLYFGFDKTEILNPDILPAYLASGLDYLRADSTSCLQVTGHTCDIGTTSYNMDLGMRRAESVQKYLLANGLASECIRIESKGESTPSVPNTGEANRKLNRRVELHINH